MGEQRTTSIVLMIRPRSFGFNAETAGTNAFLAAHASAAPAEAERLAEKEFDAFAELLVSKGVRVLAYDDVPEPRTPDAVFPNNWISFHGDERAVLYPMLATNRRAEVRREVVERVERDLSAHWRTVDLTGLASRGAFLEGTGSLVLDRARHVAFACRSARTTPEGLATFAERMGYEIVAFDALDSRGTPVYHTNVMMALGDAFVVVCFDSMARDADRTRVRQRLDEGGLEIVPISVDQRDCFAGNMLAVRSEGGAPLIVMSRRALGSLEAAQVSTLERHGEIVAAGLETIEDIGGGSARCMLAEVFPPT